MWMLQCFQYQCLLSWHETNAIYTEATTNLPSHMLWSSDHLSMHSPHLKLLDATINCFCIQASCLLYFFFRHFAHMNTFAQTPCANSRTDARRSAVNIFQYVRICSNMFQVFTWTVSAKLRFAATSLTAWYETNIFWQAVKVGPWLLSSLVFIIFLSNLSPVFLAKSSCFQCLAPAPRYSGHSRSVWRNCCGFCVISFRLPLQPRNCSSLNFWRQSSTTPKAPFPKILMYSWAWRSVIRKRFLVWKLMKNLSDHRFVSYHTVPVPAILRSADVQFLCAIPFSARAYN